MGPIGSRVIRVSSFLQELSRRFLITTGNQRVSAFLFQRLSVVLQQCNAVYIRSTFGAVQDNDFD